MGGGRFNILFLEESESKTIAELHEQIKINAEPPRPIFIYFVGNRTNGKSWCPDCIDSDAFILPLIESIRSHQDPSLSLKEDKVFLVALVGERDSWKNPESPFRKEFGLTSIPSLLNYTTKELLDGDKLTLESAKKLLTA